jgi:hypothetical protein
VPSLVTYLRAQHVAIADQTQHIVSNLSYAGDEGGIVCHIASPDKEEALVVSLTQVRVPRSMPLLFARSRSVGAFAVKPIIRAAAHHRNPGHAAAASSLVHRNSVPSTHMRCMMTASRRATATIARFMPRCRAIFMPQALVQGFDERSRTELAQVRYVS